MPEDTSPQHIQQQMCAFFRLKLGFIITTLHWVRLPAQPRHQGRFRFKPDAHWSPGGWVPSVFGAIEEWLVTKGQALRRVGTLSTANASSRAARQTRQIHSLTFPAQTCNFEASSS